MGQQPSKPSKELARLEVVSKELSKVSELLGDLLPLATAERLACKPCAPGSHQARERAAFAHFNQLSDESLAIGARMSECRTGMQRLLRTSNHFQWG